MLSYIEIINGVLKKNNKNFIKKNISDIFNAKMKFYLNDYIEVFDEKRKKCILNKDNNNLEINFNYSGRGGEKRIDYQKISLPSFSFWNKISDIDISSTSHIVVSLYVPILINNNNEVSFELDKIIYLMIEKQNVFDRKNTKNMSSRWVSIHDIYWIYKNYDNLELNNLKLNKNNNVYIMNEKQFIHKINNILNSYNLNKFQNIDSLLNSKETQNILFNKYNEEEYDLVFESKTTKVKQQLRKLFKDKLLKHNEAKCMFPNCKINMKDILIASHIYAVSKILKNNKINKSNKIAMITDYNNGFLFCPTHDYLFDKYFVSFDELGNIILSNSIKNYIDKFEFDLSKKIKLNNKNKEYLINHRKYLKQ